MKSKFFFIAMFFVFFSVITALVIERSFKTPELKKIPIVVHTFEECIQSDFPISSSPPVQCFANGKIFNEKPKTETETEAPVKAHKTCPKDRVRNGVCTMIYKPVCAKVQIQCFTTPCNPVDTTFGNSCEACNNPLISGYTDGACK